MYGYDTSKWKEGVSGADESLMILYSAIVERRIS